MSADKIDELMALIAAWIGETGDLEPSFSGLNHIYETIDNIALGDIPWQRFSVVYTGNPPPRKEKSRHG